MNQCYQFVAYYRVSTQKQKVSGLGIEAQKASVQLYAQGKGEIIAEYCETESGKKSKRKQLELAIQFAKDKNATLLIAKLDRLSRDIEFIFKLKNSGVEFVCADMPETNTLTIGIFATLAQYERELISQRTKAALAEKKKQGFKLGNPKNFSNEGRMKGTLATKNNALENPENRKAFAVIKALRSQNISYAKIADELNKCGMKTVRGKKFQTVTVHRIFKMYNKKELENTTNTEN